MSESLPNNSGSEGPKQPMSFGEYLAAVVSRPPLSPENRERVALTTETLMWSGLAHALLGGFLLSENFPEMLKWTFGVPAALWIIGCMIRRDVTMHADSTVGWAIGLTSVGVEALLKMGQLETGEFLHAVVFGAMTLFGAAVTAHVGRPFVRQFIHPQVRPVVPKE